MFMDTGLGSKAYSIIEQGKIGQILSTKPADRRAIIEEAAGITKYKARRRQTQLKLEAAQQNLLRVNDIINEVEKQLESLKRQAAKARRWRAARDEVRGVERVVFGRRFLELSEQARGLDERHATEAERERAASLALETEEAQLEVRRQGLYELEAALEEARALDRLIREFDLTHAEAADAVGRSRGAVSNLLRLQDLADKVKPLLESRELEMGHARALLGITNAMQQLDAARQVVRKGLSVRETERLVKRMLDNASGKKPSRPVESGNADIRRLEIEVTEKIGAKVRLQHSKKWSGKVVISYNNLDELDGILKHIK